MDVDVGLADELKNETAIVQKLCESKVKMHCAELTIQIREISVQANDSSVNKRRLEAAQEFGEEFKTTCSRQPGAKGTYAMLSRVAKVIARIEAKERREAAQREKKERREAAQREKEERREAAQREKEERRKAAGAAKAVAKCVDTAVRNRLKNPYSAKLSNFRLIDAYDKNYLVLLDVVAQNGFGGWNRRVWSAAVTVEKSSCKIFYGKIDGLDVIMVEPYENGPPICGGPAEEGQLGDLIRVFRRNCRPSSAD